MFLLIGSFLELSVERGGAGVAASNGPATTPSFFHRDKGNASVF
jgi:hypothetical protein